MVALASAESWIQRLYDADAVVHSWRCESRGLQRPQEAFIQLFHSALLSHQVSWANSTYRGHFETFASSNRIH
jgi:hypothetical protein